MWASPVGGMMIDSAGSQETLTSMDVSLGWDTLLEIIAVALLLSTIAGVIATVQITKYEPIKILMERT
jgi:putative ABC transport system permease protein